MNIRFAIAAATAAALGVLMVASAAHAQTRDAAPTAQVHYGDLNMQSPQGKDVLGHRIFSAAQLVCGADAGVTDLYTRNATANCVQRAMIDAQKALAARMGITLAAR